MTEKAAGSSFLVLARTLFFEASPHEAELHPETMKMGRGRRMLTDRFRLWTEAGPRTGARSPKASLAWTSSRTRNRRPRFPGSTQGSWFLLLDVLRNRNLSFCSACPEPSPCPRPGGKGGLLAIPRSNFQGSVGERWPAQAPPHYCVRGSYGPPLTTCAGPMPAP